MANSMATPQQFGVRGHIQIGKWPLYASTGAFGIGDFLKLHTTGEATLAAANNAAVTATSGNSHRILGRALKGSVDENDALRTTAEYIIAQPGTEFCMPVYNDTQASAIATPATDPLTSYGLYNVGGTFAVNNGDTSAVKCCIKDFDQDDVTTWPAAITAGTSVNPRVWVEFLPAHCFTSIAS